MARQIPSDLVKAFWSPYPIALGVSLAHPFEDMVTSSNPGPPACSPQGEGERHHSSAWSALLVLGRCLLLASVIGPLCGCATKHSDATADDYGSVYNKPLASSGALFATLPPAVQTTVKAEAGAAEVRNVVKDTSAGRIVYRIYFQNRELLPPLYVAPDGSLLDPSFQVAIRAMPEHINVLTGGPVSTLSLSDLPPAVVKAIQRQAPDAQVDTIEREVHGEPHAEQTSYVITFKDRMHPELRIGSDGTVLSGAAK